MHAISKGMQAVKCVSKFVSLYLGVFYDYIYLFSTSAAWNVTYLCLLSFQTNLHF